MQLIQNNPYRIVGLLVGATARDQERQIKRLKQFIEAEQKPDNDFSFPSLGQLDRTIDIINDASSKLNLDKDKIHAALFWFYIGNAITDEPAIAALQDSVPANAIEIWSNLTNKGEITQRNSSAFHNLSTILLYNAGIGSKIDNQLFEQGITLKLKYLESDFYKVLQTKATDETFKISRNDLQLSFLNSLYTESVKNGGIDLQTFLSIINKQDFSAKDDFLKYSIQKPIEEIEKKIEDTRKNRKANKSNAINLGKTLYEQTSEGLLLLKSFLEPPSIKFSAISDKLSDEILQCGIDYFLCFRDSQTDPGNDSMSLFKIAQTLAIGNIAKQRCQENIENLKKWIDNKSVRDSQRIVGSDIEFITDRLEEFQLLEDSVDNAHQLATSCKPHLDNIKSALGRRNKTYSALNSAVINNALDMLISCINNSQYSLDTKVIESAWPVFRILSSYHMPYKLKESFDSNKEAFKQIYKRNTEAYFIYDFLIPPKVTKPIKLVFGIIALLWIIIAMLSKCGQ